MHVRIFDVEHGGCAAIETPNNHLILVDCGHNSSTGWRPSSWIRSFRQSLSCLYVTNIDEDHVTDLPHIARWCPPARFQTNWLLRGDWIAQKKRQTGGIGSGVAEVIRFIDEVYTVPGGFIDYGVEIRAFCHPPTLFGDFNNLSLVVFLFFGSFGIVFPGDLEADGWQEMLRLPDFRACLQRTTVFVASHHGRQNGYNENIFNYCRPSVIIKSDKAIEHFTQTQGMPYERHVVAGVSFPDGNRKVLTTRNDGRILIHADASGSFRVWLNAG